MSETAAPKGYRPRRTFTLKEANQTLPLVSRIIRDIVDVHRKISDLDAQAHRLREAGQRGEADGIREQIHDQLAVLDDFSHELDQIGCEFKDPFQGLVDFPAKLSAPPRSGERIVYLCWKMGEREIRYWHELHAGFAGRQPVDGFF